MRHFIPTLTVIAIAAGNLFAGELASEADLTGTWRIEPSTFTVRSLAIPNTFERPHLPTNHYAFALELRRDGTLVATNVPPGLFFDDWPAMARVTGRWDLNNSDTWTFLSNGIPVKTITNVYSSLKLSLDRPPSEYGAWSRPVDSIKDSKASRKPGVALGPYRDKSGTYEWSVLITRQDRDAKQ